MWRCSVRAAQHSETTIDLGPALERGVGVPHGSILLEFATAAHRDLP